MLLRISGTIQENIYGKGRERVNEKVNLNVRPGESRLD